MPLTPLKDSETMVKEVEALTKDLDRLRVNYEQYFLGLEREEPLKLRGKVADVIKKYAGTVVQNARLNFRLQQAVAKFNTYTTYWNRTLREIEEGKYTRDVFRAKLHAKGEEAPTKKEKGGKKEVDPLAALYDQYVEARKKCNESLAGLTLDAFRKSMNAQIDALKQKTKGAEVKFHVVTEAGKTKIKAIPIAPASSKSGA